MNRIFNIIALLCSIYWLTACDRLFGPQDYDECVLKAMQGVDSDLAARSIMKSCHQKFPEKKPDASELPSEALNRLTGHGSVGITDTFSGNIYNGNNDWTITQVTIRLTPTGLIKDDADVLFKGNKDYNEDVEIKPLTSVDIFFSIDRESSQYNWNIVKARGFRSE